jgi:hypothetical protein
MGLQINLPFAIERRNQSIYLALPLVQFLWYRQSVRRVVRAQGEWIDATMRLPFRQAPPRIGFQARGGLLCKKSK